MTKEEMDAFSAENYPETWHGLRVYTAAQALEWAIFRFQRCKEPGIWQESYQRTVNICQKDLHLELLIAASGQAQQTLKSMSRIPRGAYWA